ncbi:MAG: DUF4271 domain-containing protein [Saprospiraceae bacterium]
MIKRFAVGILLFMWSWAPAGAQPNPFDLRHRLPYVEEVVPSWHTGNPFDVAPHIPPGLSALQQPELAFRIRRIGKFLPEGNSLHPRFFFWVMSFLGAWFVLSVVYNRQAAVRVWAGFLTNNALQVNQRDLNAYLGTTPYALLQINFLLNSGVFAFFLVQVFSLERYNNLKFFLLCAFITPLLMISKRGILAVVSRIYPVKTEAERYDFLVLTFNCVLGLFLFPFNFVTAFYKEDGGFLVFWMLALVVLFYAYRALRGLLIGQKIFTEHPFHFLLYLCVAEMSPIALVWKVVDIASRA